MLWKTHTKGICFAIMQGIGTLRDAMGGTTLYLLNERQKARPSFEDRAFFVVCHNSVAVTTDPTINVRAQVLDRDGVGKRGVNPGCLEGL